MSELTTNLYVNPSYITARYDFPTKQRTKLQEVTRIQNFKSNTFTGVVSKHSIRKIRLAVQWLVALAKTKQVRCPNTNKTFHYRAGLATVSLPTGCENVHEAFFRDTLLTSLLDAMKYRFDLKNYIWKIEKQKRGTLHVHITLDQFIPYDWLNDQWCKILDKHGLLEEYRSRFSAMSRADYVKHRLSTDSDNYSKFFPSHLAYIKSLIRAYKAGTSNNWSRPNCTDIHAIKNVKNLASYMVKYLSKDPGLSEGFKGRYWACSHSLSKLRTITVNIPEREMSQFSTYIESCTVGSEDLYYFRKLDNEPVFLGAIYFLKRSFSALFNNPFLRSLFQIIRSLYHSSRMDDIPYFVLTSQNSLNFQLKTIYQNAN